MNLDKFLFAVNKWIKDYKNQIYLKCPTDDIQKTTNYLLEMMLKNASAREILYNKNFNTRSMHRIRQSELANGIKRNVQKGCLYAIRNDSLYLALNKWNKVKQVYSFDADFVSELLKTPTDVDIPYTIFDRLPYQTFFIDFTSLSKIYAEFIEKDSYIMNGALVDINKVNDSLYRLNITYYSEKAKPDMYYTDIIPIEKERNGFFTINDITASIASEDSSLLERGILIFPLILYMCSYKPDIHEVEASSKSLKTSTKAHDDSSQIHEHKVGVRTGEAFRKWTKGQLGQSSEHTSTGRHNRPHVRKAHWHRHWIGKRGSDERQLVIRWHTECFCCVEENTAESKLDTVQHEVRKESK